jgi:hypothetical protein
MICSELCIPHRDFSGTPLFTDASLRPPRFKKFHRNPGWQTLATILALRSVHHRAASAKAQIEQLSVQLAVHLRERVEKKRFCLLSGQVGAGVGLRQIELNLFH